MYMNKNKTKVMSCRKLNSKWLNINIIREPYEQMQSYYYFDSKITEDGKSKFDIINRISKGKSAFQKKYHLLRIVQSYDYVVHKTYT